VPLYPIGFICEGVIALRNIPYFEETEQFSILLPNRYGTNFILRANACLLFLSFFFCLPREKKFSRKTCDWISPEIRCLTPRHCSIKKFGSVVELKSLFNGRQSGLLKKKIFTPRWNISFYFPNLIRAYLLFGFFPLLYTQMWHMYQLR
jgi:hypothetical protein